MEYGQVMRQLKSMGNEENRQGMKRFGINVDAAFGISVTELRKFAKSIKRDDELAVKLWASGIHEARMLACLIVDPAQFGDERLEKWVSVFDSWDIVDICSMTIFCKLPDISYYIHSWAAREEAFVRRTAFATIAAMAFKNKKLSDEDFEPYFELMLMHSNDSRNFVKKSVNWALRQVGKRNTKLNARAIEVANKILATDSPSARWIARDALRELQSDAVRQRLAERGLD